MRKAAWYLGLALFLAAAVGTAVLFYFGGYRALLSNNSSSFTVELVLTQVRAHPDATVLVVGNSTAAEGFLAEYFNQHAGGVKALNLGVPSGNVYLYERLLALSMDKGIRPRSVVVMITPDMLSTHPSNDVLLNDLTLLKTVVDSSDVLRLKDQSPNLASYFDDASRVILRPVLFRADLRDFFRHPRERLTEAKTIRQWFRTFGPQSTMPETDRQFSVCSVGSLSDLPAAIDRLRKAGRNGEADDYQHVQDGYGPRLHAPLQIGSFEVERFERLLAHLRSLVPAVYVTAAPYYDPNFDQYPQDYRRDYSVALRRAVESVPGVSLLPDFQADCSMMFDTVHLNRKGGEQFTEYLRTRVL